MTERDEHGREWVRIPGVGRIDVTPPEGMPNMPLDMRVQRALEDLERQRAVNDHLYIGVVLMTLLAMLVLYWAIAGAPLLAD